MAANRFLAKTRGLSEKDIQRIDDIHIHLEWFIEDCVIKNKDESKVLEEIEKWEFLLQEIWGFPKDPSTHVWKNKYLFKKQWAFTTWECEETGESFTIPYEVEETDFYVIGNGFVDIGRFPGYYRVSGVKQIA